MVRDHDFRSAGECNGGVRIDHNAAFKFQTRSRREHFRRLQSETSRCRLPKIAPRGGLHAIPAAGARRQGGARVRLRMNFGQKLGHRSRLHQGCSRRIAHEIVNYSLLPEPNLSLRWMDVDIDLGSWHLQKQQDNRK